MTDRYECSNAHLNTIVEAQRERRTTPRHFTVVRPLLVALALLLVACGGGKKRTDTYAKATDALGDCCENLKGPDRDRCLADVVRVEDPEAAKTTTAQATYACVVEHFVCNPQTGRPTEASAQAQYDCIEDQAR